MRTDNRMHFNYIFGFKPSRREGGAGSGQGLWTCAMGLLACLLIAAFVAPGSAYGADAVDSFVASAFQMVQKHRDALPRLIAPANATADALIAGGKFYVGGDAGFASEATGRAGGTMAVHGLSASNPPVKGDVVWLAYEPSTYTEVAQ
jgi:hypothetical protein